MAYVFPPVVDGAQFSHTSWVLILPPAPLIRVSTTWTPEQLWYSHFCDNSLFSSSDDEQVSQVIEKLKDRFETVALGDGKYLLGKEIHRNLLGKEIHRNVHAGTII